MTSGSIRRQRSLLALAAFAVSILAAGKLADAATWYVRQGATGSGQLAWANASGDLKGIIEIAEDYDAIWVAQGTYHPTDFESPSPFITFEVYDKRLQILGGFPPTGEPDGDDRDPETYETILDGEFEIGEETYNVYSVVEMRDYEIELDDDMVLDGFTIRNGQCDTGDKNGGGIEIQDGYPVVSHCKITDNSATSGAMNYGGAGIACRAPNTPGDAYFLRIDECTITGNTGEARGAGVLVTAGTATRVGIVRCAITDNDGSDGYGGGGVHVFAQSYQSQADVHLVNCLLAGNAAPMGGALMVEDEVSGAVVTVTNCVVTENEASVNGGAIYNWDGTLNIHDSTIVENTASYQGGAIYAVDSVGSTTIIANSIVWDNVGGNAGTVGDQIYLYTTDSDLYVWNCDVMGGQSDVGGGGTVVQWLDSIDSDPLFVNGSNGNYRLVKDSPCIDEGDETLLPEDTFDLDGDQDVEEALPWDYDGEDRVFAYEAEEVDMGAFEFWCTADVNFDGVVDVLDLLAVLGAWGPCEDCDEDVNGDDVVDVLDLLAVLSQWGCGLPPAQREPAPEGIDDCIERYGDDFEKMEACITTIILTQGGE